MFNVKNSNAPKGSSTPKVITPGEQVCKINKITLESPPYNKDAVNVVMHVETQPLGDDFEGFFIDKNNPDGGRYAGQIGRVKSSEYPYSDGTTKSGIQISRDIELARFLENLLKIAGKESWLDANEGVHETAESYVEAINKDNVLNDIYFRFCVGGKEYLNKEGYTNFDLFLVKSSRGSYNMESFTKNPEASSNFIKFDESVHIKKKKTDVESFGDVTTTSSVSSSFEL